MEQSDEDELKENLQIDYLASKTQECDSTDSLTSSSNNTSKCSDSSPYDIGTDESDRLADDSSQKSPKKRLLTLCWRLICDIMLVIFIISTVLGVVTNSNQPKIRGAKRPRPFLINAGPVKDYYQGDVFQTFSDAGLFENSLVMFYAPGTEKVKRPEVFLRRWENSLQKLIFLSLESTAGIQQVTAPRSLVGKQAAIGFLSSYSIPHT